MFNCILTYCLLPFLVPVVDKILPDPSIFFKITSTSLQFCPFFQCQPQNVSARCFFNLPLLHFLRVSRIGPALWCNHLACVEYTPPTPTYSPLLNMDFGLFSATNRCYRFCHFSGHLIWRTWVHIINEWILFVIETVISSMFLNHTRALPIKQSKLWCVFVVLHMAFHVFPSCRIATVAFFKF